MAKLLTGIAAAVVGGLILWWLTHEGGLLNPRRTSPPPRQPAPSIKLLDTDIKTPDVSQRYGERMEGTFVVYNEGDATAEGCVLWFLEGGSKKFGLAPGERRQVVARTRHFTEHGTYEVVARIACEGYRRELYRQRYAF